MKKVLALILALSMIFCLCACGSKPKEDRLETIKKQGYISLATEPYFAPYEFIDPSKSGDEQYVGADIELAKVIADKIGVELKIVPLDFTAVLAGVTEGKYDMAISAIAYSPAREDAMALSEGYKTDKSEYGILVREEDKDKYQTIDDIKEAIVITQSGSVQEAIYKDCVGDCKEFKLTSQMTDGYLAVAENKADVCIVSITSAQLYADANGGLYIPELRFDTDPRMSSTVVGTPKGCDSLMAVINEAIAECLADGRLAGWFEEYADYAKSLGIE